MNISEEKYNWAYPLTRRSRTTLLVLHHEAGSGSTAQQIHNYHRYTNGWCGIAYHYYVRKDGTICRRSQKSRMTTPRRSRNWNGRSRSRKEMTINKAIAAALTAAN